VSITGDLDPVGGHFFRAKAEWAYMSVPGQLSLVDDQSALNIRTRDELIAALVAALRDRAPPDIGLQNPHSWLGYIDRHREDLRGWIQA
jgi:hypothetical protein